MTEEIKNRINELIDLINYYSDQYYNTGVSEISDAEFDRLYDEYLQYAEEYPEIKDWENSPTKAVGAEVTGTFVKFTHKSPLLSIDQKSREIEELKKWYNKLENKQVIVEPKLDGITVNLNYEEGKFVNAATRGNGKIGDLITEQFKNTDTVYPKKLNNIKTLEFRGEAIIPYDYFVENNMKDEYSNPRNAVAGIMHSKDPEDVKDKGIQVMFYDIGVIDEGILTDSDDKNIEKIYEEGFCGTPHIICNSWDELKSCVEKRMNGYIIQQDGFNVLNVEGYPKAICDGIVIKANSIDEREQQGFSQKGPKWAFAFKFKPLQEITTLREVEWQIGKSGRVTPVAIFDAISLGGTTITRATLNNPSYMENLPLYDKEKGINLNYISSLCYGDKILVERSNDVIPRVVAIVEHITYTKCTPPTKCPKCGWPLRYDGTLLWCTNGNCPSQLLGKIQHWAKRNAMDIVGLSIKTIETLHEEGFLNSVADLYRLKDHRDELIKIDRFGKKSVDNLLKSIDESRTRELSRFIYALSIPNVGRVMSEDLAKKYKTIQNFIYHFDYDEILSLDSFGEVYAKSTYMWLYNRDNVDWIEEILEAGVTPKEFVEQKAESNKLDGKTFVITGTLSQPRNYFVDMITKNGGKIGSGVSKNTDYLLVGENAGSKLTKAEKLGIKILSEDEFNSMIS